LARIDAVQPPYGDAVGRRLEAMMPPGVPPILLFRTFVRNLPMADAMGAWGRYELSRRLSLSMRAREIVIDRTCARCRCEYEWGVHVAYFAQRVDLTAPQLGSLVHGDASDACWSRVGDRILIEVVDSLHDIGQIADGLWGRLVSEFDESQVLDLVMLCGWYHAISFAANGLRLDPEEGTPRFTDVG
jgi:hypothetical protein